MSGPFDLTASILQLTSGPACARLHGLAWDLAAGQLDAETAELARRHLEHCAACRARVAHLEAAQRLLPGFADLDPGGAFAGAVLARTRRLRPLALDPLLEGWARLMRRPRAALEAAYLATAAGLVCTQIPLPGLDRPAGPAFAALVRQEVRGPLTEAASLRQAWTARLQAPGPILALAPTPAPAPGPVPGPSPQRLLRPGAQAWSRLVQRLQRAGRNLGQSLRAFPARLRQRAPSIPPAPPAAEPSAAPQRPAP